MKNVNKHLIFILLAALLFGTVLTACGGEDPTPTPRSSNDDDDDGDPPPDEDEEEPTEEPTPEPTETPDPTAGFIDFSNEVLGVSLAYPGDWAMELDEEAGELKLASSQTILEDSDDNIEGAILNVLLLDTALFSALDAEVDLTDPVQLLGVFVDFFSQPSDEGITVTVTQEPTAVTINGQSAAEVLVDAVDEEGDAAVMKVLVIMFEDRAAVVLSGSEVSVEEQNRPLLNAIENSIVLSTPVGGSIEDVDTGNIDINLSGDLLLYGDTVAGIVDESGPSVWGFIGLEDEVVDIFVVPEGDFDLVFDVMDDSGKSILPDGEVDASFGAEEALGVVIPATGNYAIVVRGFADETGNYTLTLAEAGTATAPPTSDGDLIEYGAFISGEVNSTTPIAAYSFSGAAEDVVGIVVTPYDELDAVLDVVDAAGNSLLAQERDVSFGPENLFVTLPADGIYTVNVYGFDGAEGSFDLQMSMPLTNVVFAAGDSLEAEDEGEGHAFPFTTLRAGDMVGIRVEPDEELDVAIQVRRGDELLSGLGFDPERGFSYSVGIDEFVMIAQETGTYSFRILNSQDEFAGNVGDYLVTLYGTPEVIFELAYGDVVDARTNADGLVDYVISGLAGDNIVINVASDDDSVDMVIEVLDLDENILASIDDGFSGEVEELAYTFESDDLIIIRVRDFYGGEGNFIMTVNLQ